MPKAKTGSVMLANLNFILIFLKRCGTGAIVGYWKNILLMVGPQKDWVKYPCNEKLTNVIVFRLM